jgi:hypothetical protein
MHLCAKPPRPSLLWKRIPPRLETLLLKLLEKDPAARATLAEVRATLSALRPVVTQSLDRVDEAPPPEAPLRSRRTRHALGLAVVAVSFLALAIAGYRPSKLRAHETAATVAPVASKESHAPVAGAPTTAPSLAAPSAMDHSAPAHLAPHRARRSRRDANYLLDPFAH